MTYETAVIIWVAGPATCTLYLHAHNFMSYSVHIDVGSHVSTSFPHREATVEELEQKYLLMPAKVFTYMHTHVRFVACCEGKWGNVLDRRVPTYLLQHP